MKAKGKAVVGLRPMLTAKTKLTDDERHKRFVDMAHEVGADEQPEAFEKAFDRSIEKRPKPAHS